MGEDLPLEPIRQIGTRRRRGQEEPELSGRKVLRHGAGVAFETMRLPGLGVMPRLHARFRYRPGFGGSTGASRSSTMAMRRLPGSVGSSGIERARNWPCRRPGRRGRLRRRRPAAPCASESARPAESCQSVSGLHAAGAGAGVAVDADPVGQLVDDLGDRPQQQLGAIVGRGRALLEHRAAFLVDQLDAQALGRLVDDDVLRQLGQLRHVLQRLAQGLGGRGERGVFAVWLRPRPALPPASSCGVLPLLPSLLSPSLGLREEGASSSITSLAAGALGAVAAKRRAAEDAAGARLGLRHAGRGEVVGDARASVRAWWC